MAKAVNLNEDLCKHLASIATHEKEMNQNMSRFFAYMKASRAIAGHDKRITSGKEAQELKGVGPKVAVIVDKFLSGEAGDGDGDEKAEEGGDGKPVASSSKDGKRSKSKSKSRDAGGRKHNKDDDEDKDADADGPPTKKAKKSSTALTTTDSMRILDHYEKLYMDKKTALGLQVKEVNTVGDLRQDTSLVTGAQAACLEAIADLVMPIDGKEEMEALAKELKKRIKEALGDHIRLTVCGAYRRGDALDSSLTVLLVHKELSSTSEKAKEELADSLQKVLAALKDVLKYRLDEAKDVGGDGGKSSTTATDRFEALIQLNNSNNNNSKWSRVRRLSLRIVPKDCSVGALFTLTGSKRFVESIVFEALERRFSLDENGLRRLGATNVPGQLIPLKSEEELFEYLELPYKKPEERKD